MILSKEDKVIEFIDGDSVWILTGRCSKCGSCCEYLKCEFLYSEMNNDIELKKCRIYRTRPWYCALYPRNPNKMFNNCTYKWEKI